MKRADKILKRKLRADKRAAAHMQKYVDKIKKAQNMPGNLSLSDAKYYSSANCWPDSNSPTGYTQICSYEEYGTCQSPCNGDC